MMKLKMIELEIDKDELKASSTLGEQASILLKKLFMALNGNEEQENDETEENDDDDPEL